MKDLVNLSERKIYANEIKNLLNHLSERKIYANEIKDLL